MRVFDLALKDLSQLIRDWKSAVFLLVMPILFTLLFGFIFSGAGEDVRLPVGFLDQDDGILSPYLLELLNASDIVRPVALKGESADAASRRVSDEELAAVIVIPDGYTERVLKGEEVRLTLILNDASPAEITARNGIKAATMRLLGAVQIARLSEKASDHTGSVDEDFLEEALEKAVAAWENPSLTVTMTQSRASTAEGEAAVAGPNDYAHSSPSMMVQFAMAGLIGAGEILMLERKSKALQRLLTTTISRNEIILGHFLSMFVMIFLQLLLLVGFGQFVLSVDYLREPLALLLVMTAMALWTASMGLLIGVLAQTEEQVVTLAIVPMLILSALGGAWIPLEFTSQTFQTVGRFTPTAWAVDGFENLVIRGLGLRSALLPTGIMLAYTVLFFGLAAWRFRFE